MVCVHGAYERLDISRPCASFRVVRVWSCMSMLWRIGWFPCVLLSIIDYASVCLGVGNKDQASFCKIGMRGRVTKVCGGGWRSIKYTKHQTQASTLFLLLLPYFFLQASEDHRAVKCGPATRDTPTPIYLDTSPRPPSGHTALRGHRTAPPAAHTQRRRYHAAPASRYNVRQM